VDAGGSDRHDQVLIGVIAGYEAPLVSSLTASYLLRTETDPEKRRQLETFRKWSLGWLAFGIAVAVVGIIVFVSFASSHGLGGGGSSECRGGIDTMDPMNTTYLSDADNQWTATYPLLRRRLHHRPGAGGLRARRRRLLLTA
jgi:hypothetical protein